MNKNPKVVAFHRSAEYMHHRAMMNRRENRILDALELMRSAVEASPENSEYRLDLAELYCEIGCHGQSTRLLLDMLSEEGAPSECYYGLALNQMGMSDISGARQTLDIYRKRAPRGSFTQDAGVLSRELDDYLDAGRLASRRLSRAMRVANNGCEAMKAGLPEKACRLFGESLQMASEQYEMRALYAMALIMAGDEAQARVQADRASEGYPPSVRALCVCAQVYYRLGMHERAMRLMDAAEREKPMGQELRLMLLSAGEMDMYARAAEYARLALQEAPYDRELLHIRAVALKKGGAPDDEAGKCWKRILRLDPEDTVAQYYADAADRHALDAEELDFNYQVTGEEYVRRVNWIKEVMAGELERAHAPGALSPEFLMMLRWASLTDDLRVSEAAVAMLAVMENPEARSVLRELMLQPGVSREAKLHAALLTQMQGKSLTELLPAELAGTGGGMVDIDALVSELPVGERQLVRFASEVLDELYDMSALPALAMLWTTYRLNRGTRCDPLIRMESSAAALACNYLRSVDIAPDYGKLAAAFGCDERQLKFCARRMARCLIRRKRRESLEAVRF